MGQPAGRHGPARNLVVPGVRREVKHLSTCRKGYSVSSGERKRIRPNHGRVIPVGVAFVVLRERVPVPTDRAGVIKRRARGRLEGRAAGCQPRTWNAPSPIMCPQVARASWNPV